MSDKPREFWVSWDGVNAGPLSVSDKKPSGISGGGSVVSMRVVDAKAFERIAKELERSEVQLQLNRNGIGEHVNAYAEAVSLIRELRDIFRLLLPTLPASTQIDRCSDGISKADLFLKGGK